MCSDPGANAYALSALGGCIFYLRRLLLDVELLSLGKST
jgi:hypothetical protein